MPNEKITPLILYRQKTEKKASQLFSKLLPKQNNSLKWNVLVIAAGSFPGYLPLLRQLIHTMPNLQQVNFTLIEPVKKWTDIFLENFAKLPANFPDIEITFSIVNVGLAEYLETASHATFDLIYFEHPETMTLPILLAKSGLRSFQRVITFRNSLPFLAPFLKPDSIIIASCMTRHELTQLKSLLSFGLNVQCTLTTSFNPLSYFYGGPFSAGLQGKLDSHSSVSDVKKKSNMIAKSDTLLFIFILISLVIYFMRFIQSDQFAERLWAIVLIGAQLFFHRPGLNGLFIKIGLFTLLLALALY